MAFYVEEARQVQLTCRQHGDFEVPCTSVTAIADLDPVDYRFCYSVLSHCPRGCHLTKVITREQYTHLTKSGAAPITAEVVSFLLQWTHFRSQPARPAWRRAIDGLCQWWHENW